MQNSEKDYIRYLTVKGFSEKSIKTYSSRVKIFIKWLKDNDLELNRNNVEEYLFRKKELGFSNAALNSYIQALKQLAKCYKNYGHDYSFMEDISGLPKDNPTIIPLSYDESVNLLNTKITYKNRNGVNCDDLDFKYLTMTEFILYSACRFSEAANLTVGQLDLDKNRALLIKTKNKSDRFIFFEGPVKEHLRKLISDKKPSDFIFTNSKGSKMLNGDFDNNLKKRAKLAGITKKINAHLLRHTNATLHYNNTHDIAMTASILGHKDINVTYNTYVHLDTDGIQQGASRNPLFSKYISPNQVLNNVKKVIDDLKLNEDSRFLYEIGQSSHELVIKVKIKEA